MFTKCLTRLYHVLNRFLIGKLIGLYLNLIVVHWVFINLDNMLVDVNRLLVHATGSDEPQLNNIYVTALLFD